ncbi:zinc-binding alcohol dehydrogenase family protein [Isosphaeraceae bacterium EP7]
MKAIQLESPKNFRRLDVPEPESPGPGMALVKVHRVGICGTDVSGYLGKMPFFKYPRIPGHELGVEVIAVGPEVGGIKVGDRCSVEPYMNCGHCHACRKGATNCCATLEVLGVMVDGGLRERFLVRADKLHPSTTLGYDELALVETLAIGCHAVARSGLQAGEPCLIVGAGPIGLASLQFARLAGARTIMLDMNPTRLEFCKASMGAEHILMPSDHLDDDLRALTDDGSLPDVLIDATGSAASMSASFGRVAPTGRVVFVGITTDEVTFRHPIFHRPEGTLFCSRNALPADFRRIIGLIEGGQVDTAPWISHRASFDSLIDVFPGYTKPETGVIKAIVEMDV